MSSIVAVTATPYAPASRLDEPKETTKKTQPTSSAAFMAGR